MRKTCVFRKYSTCDMPVDDIGPVRVLMYCRTISMFRSSKVEAFFTMKFTLYDTWFTRFCPTLGESRITGTPIK